ncbi:MAG: GerMN domain-containing protein [Lachnospiraceae bacterium]|nr:GerMN domain-containing protein [Lachnospiraceae bacterium]
MNRAKQDNRMIGFLRLLFLTFLPAVFLASCGSGKGEAQESAGLRIYYLNKTETALVSSLYVPQSDPADTEQLLEELLEQEAAVPEKEDWHAPLQFDFALRQVVVDGNQAVLELSETYRELSPTREILVRAALVRTIVQAPGIEGVSMRIGEEPLLNRSGNPVGVMQKDTFVDNEGVEINAYDQAALHLYFADESGTGLVETTQNVIYNTNLSMERLVVESLIAGPEGTGMFATIDPDTRIISVTNTDGVCYVNLSSDFTEAVGNVTPDVTLYSIVNSLVELSSVHRVQFMVNGESKMMYREVINLENSFSRNLDLVK